MLSVRLAEAELRRFKAVAASRGVSLQQAVHEAVEAWASTHRKSDVEGLDSLEGSLAGIDTQALLRSERDAELKTDERRS